MSELIVQSGKHQGKRLRLPPDSEVLIGRDQDCQVRVASSDVSRHHCALKQTPDGLLVRDLGSRNGTYLNDVLMEEETLLQPGDLLRVGPIVFQVPGGKTDLPSAQVKDRAKGAAPLSDDDIAAWLSQEALISTDGRVAGPGDTTIIPTMPKTNDDSDESSDVDVEAEAADKDDGVKEPQARQFRKIAEEAADIIRRHWEIVKAEENIE